jgi:hypothetical protein
VLAGGQLPFALLHVSSPVVTVVVQLVSCVPAAHEKVAAVAYAVDKAINGNTWGAQAKYPKSCPAVYVVALGTARLPPAVFFTKKPLTQLGVQSTS